MRRRRIALAHIAAVIIITVGGYALFQHDTRLAETWCAATVARLFGSHNFLTIGGTSILESPEKGPAFLAVVTPSCSSAASVASLVALASLIRNGSRTRRLAALAAAVLTVVAGNITRIAASLIVGLIAGRVSLVMFHDWVGSMFSFGYTLGGFILMLYIVLGDGRRPSHAVSESNQTAPVVETGKSGEPGNPLAASLV